MQALPSLPEAHRMHSGALQAASRIHTRRVISASPPVSGQLRSLQLLKRQDLGLPSPSTPQIAQHEAPGKQPPCRSDRILAVLQQQEGTGGTGKVPPKRCGMG